MAPTLSAGDDILVDLADGAERLRDGIYVLRVDGALLVKRLAIHPVGRRVTVQSDNPAYADWPDCGLDEIDCIGRVIWAGTEDRVTRLRSNALARAMSLTCTLPIACSARCSATRPIRARRPATNISAGCWRTTSSSPWSRGSTGRWSGRWRL